MNTEPIGFKGSSGDFSFDEKWHMEFIICEPSGINVLNAKGLSLEEAEANAKLMAASKKMAIALQKIEKHINLGDLTMDEIKSDKMLLSLYHIKMVSKEALKQAGL